MDTFFYVLFSMYNHRIRNRFLPAYSAVFDRCEISTQPGTDASSDIDANPQRSGHFDTVRNSQSFWGETEDLVQPTMHGDLQPSILFYTHSVISTIMTAV